jgi:GntR family transcriptional regulator / MocR family aminotransferase
MRPVAQARGTSELLLEVELRRGHMRRSLREALRQAIQDGRLAAGTALPSSRRLAAELGVSRGVVSDAYDQLVSEGYLRVRERFAPEVAAVTSTAPVAREPGPASWRFDLTAVTPDVSLFPRRAWVRAVERALADAPDGAFDYADHRGRIELRAALAGYLARVRGVRVDPSRIVVTQGFTQALDLLCRVLVAKGATTIAMETPSHPGLWATARHSGLEPVGCPVDREGLRTDQLADGADAVVVAPAHQFPTGAVLAPARRAALIEWAAARERLIVEDDYDAEFRYDRTPVGALQGLDPGRVAHVGSASKTLAPGVRLGWISAPHDLVDALREHKSAADSGSPAIDQLALADLLARGDYERHVVRARHAYRRRRDRLVAALRSTLPELEIRGAAAGMGLLLILPDGADDVEIADAASARGIGVSALSLLHLAPSPERGLLIGYGRLPEPSIDKAVAMLSAVIAHRSSPPPGPRTRRGPSSGRPPGRRPAGSPRG